MPGALPPVPIDLGPTIRTSPFAVLAMDVNGTIRAFNPVATRDLGWSEDEVVGTNGFDLIHPDDLERAVLAIAWLSGGGSFPPGMTVVRSRHRDGHWVEFEVVASRVDLDGEQLHLVWARPLPNRVIVVERVIHDLVAGTSPDEVLEVVCDFVLWRDWDSRVGICWHLDGELHWCATGAPELLVTGEDDGSPWDRARRTRQPVRASIDDLDPARREAAAALGLAELLVEPLDWGTDEPALVTVWTVGDGRTPAHHAYGISQIHTVAELVLRWTAQANELDHAARTDALTGLANRRAFFEQLEGEGGPGSVVYCDLDGFKPVNDTLGHAAGDAVLRAVAERIAATVRRGDVVARLGGDEFAVLCPGLDPDAAEALAARLRAVVDQPIDLGGTTVTVGMSVGVAHASDALGDDTLERADHALYDAKRARPAR